MKHENLPAIVFYQLHVFYKEDILKGHFFMPYVIYNELGKLKGLRRTIQAFEKLAALELIEIDLPNSTKIRCTQAGVEPQETLYALQDQAVRSELDQEKMMLLHAVCNCI